MFFRGILLLLIPYLSSASTIHWHCIICVAVNNTHPWLDVMSECHLYQCTQSTPIYRHCTSATCLRSSSISPWRSANLCLIHHRHSFPRLVFSNSFIFLSSSVTRPFVTFPFSCAVRSLSWPLMIFRISTFEQLSSFLRCCQLLLKHLKIRDLRSDIWHWQSFDQRLISQHFCVVFIELSQLPFILWKMHRALWRTRRTVHCRTPCLHFSAPSHVHWRGHTWKSPCPFFLHPVLTPHFLFVSSRQLKSLANISDSRVAP